MHAWLPANTLISRGWLGNPWSLTVIPPPWSGDARAGSSGSEPTVCWPVDLTAISSKRSLRSWSSRMSTRRDAAAAVLLLQHQLFQLLYCHLLCLVQVPINQSGHQPGASVLCPPCAICDCVELNLLDKSYSDTGGSVLSRVLGSGKGKVPKHWHHNHKGMLVPAANELDCLGNFYFNFSSCTKVIEKFVQYICTIY